MIKIKTILFSFASVILFACSTEPETDSSKQTTVAPNKVVRPNPFAKLPFNWRVKEGYEIKVFRNDQVQYPIFFKGLNTAIWFDENDLEKSKLSASIDATTIETGNPEMTTHANAPDVLNTHEFPTIIFESTAIKSTAAGYVATGNLTLKGVTKEIKLPFAFQNETFSSIFEITASDFGIIGHDLVPSGIIKIELTIPVTK